MASWNDDEL